MISIGPTDAVVAVADLVNRAGGIQFEVSFWCPHQENPDLPDDHGCESIEWTASAWWRKHVVRGDAGSAGDAADRLAALVIDGGGCRCGQRSSTVAGPGVCLWTREGPRWEPSCDAAPITVKGRRGNVAAMGRAWNREQRRRSPR